LTPERSLGNEPRKTSVCFGWKADIAVVELD
jgi:hypothetical protein